MTHASAPPPPHAPDNALVLGGTGLIGGHTARALLHAGVRVRILTRDPSNAGGLRGGPIEVMQGDAEERVPLRRAIDGCNLVVHSAAPYPRSAFGAEAQIAAALAGIELFLEEVAHIPAGGRIVYVSSITTIGHPRSNRPANEDDPWDPAEEASPYFQMKGLMEQRVLAAARNGLPIVVVNPTLTIGAHDRALTTGRLLLPLARGQMPVYLRGIINAVAAADVAEAIVTALSRGRIGQRYILGGENREAKEFLAIAARIAGVPTPKIPLPLSLAEGIAWLTEVGNRITRSRWPLFPVSGVRMMRHSQPVDSSLARRELSLGETPIESALDEAYRWYRDAGLF